VISTAVQPRQEQIIYPDLPLAIYQEIAAHLQQVDGIDTHLIPQDAPRFNYTQSQIKALTIQYPPDFKQENQPQVEAILSYYATRYGQQPSKSPIID
jgi:hypothetical protein